MGRIKRNVVNHHLFWDVFFSFHSQVTMNKENFYSTSVWLSLGFLSFCQCYILVILSSCVRFHAPHLRRINESLTVDLHLRFLLTCLTSPPSTLVLHFLFCCLHFDYLCFLDFSLPAIVAHLLVILYVLSSDHPLHLNLLLFHNQQNSKTALQQSSP